MDFNHTEIALWLDQWVGLMMKLGSMHNIPLFRDRHYTNCKFFELFVGQYRVKDYPRRLINGIRGM